METTVIVPNYNGGEFLARCLDSLAAQTRRPACVIVVDNGSADGSVELARNHPVTPRVIELDANTGFAHAVNLGIKSSETEAVSLLNNDAEAAPRWIEAGLQFLEANPLVWSVASLMLDMNDRGRIDSAGNSFDRTGRPLPRLRGKKREEAGGKCLVMGACAGAAFYRRSLFDEVGLFEDGFFAYLEDVDLGLRAASRGHLCVFTPEAVVYHAGAGTDLSDSSSPKAVDSGSRVFLIAGNRVRTLARNFPASFLLAHAPELCLGFLRSAAYHAAVSRQLKAFLAGLGTGLSHLGEDRKFYKSRVADQAPGINAMFFRVEALPWSP